MGDKILRAALRSAADSHFVSINVQLTDFRQ